MNVPKLLLALFKVIALLPAPIVTVPAVIAPLWVIAPPADSVKVAKLTELILTASYSLICALPPVKLSDPNLFTEVFNFIVCEPALMVIAPAVTAAV